MTKKLLSLAALASFALAATAQTSVPPNQVDPFKDTSMLKPPPGDKLAIIEFEDLECPHCGHAAPIIRSLVEREHIAYVHHDFPLHQGVWWSLNAAITARYLQDAISPKVAEQFRLDVFAAQSRLASEDDLARFTQEWLAKRHIERPFTTVLYRKEVMADFDLGRKLNLQATPTIFVVTPHSWIQVKEVEQLQTAVDQAKAKLASEAPARSNVRKSSTPAK